MLHTALQKKVQKEDDGDEFDIISRAPLPHFSSEIIQQELYLSIQVVK